MNICDLFRWLLNKTYKHDLYYVALIARFIQFRCEICRDRHDRQRKFLPKEHLFLNNLQESMDFTHLFCNFTETSCVIFQWTVQCCQTLNRRGELISHKKIRTSFDNITKQCNSCLGMQRLLSLSRTCSLGHKKIDWDQETCWSVLVYPWSYLKAYRTGHFS